MLVRIDANSPREAIKMALAFAAENGFAVDFRSFGPAAVKTSPKPSEKAVRKSSEKTPVKPSKKPSVKKPKASSKPKASEPTSLREVAFALRKEAENGDIKLPKDVYADLRSKDIVRLKSAIAAASHLLGKKGENWTPDKDSASLLMHFHLHEEFLHANPLLDDAK
jgi:hypothetical protein